MAKRIRILRTMALAGVPRSKLDDEISQFNENISGGVRIPPRSLDRLIPMLLRWEIADMKKEVSEQDLALIFDGATEVAEVFACVGRWVSSDWYIHQRLLACDWLAGSLSAKQQAVQLSRNIMFKLRIDPLNVVAATRDGCPVNGLCIELMKGACIHLVDISCTSHGSCLCGNEFDTSILNTVTNLWSFMTQKSQAARTMFLAGSGEQALHKAKVKWFATWAVHKQIMLNWATFLAVIDAPGDFFKETRASLRKILNDPIKMETLQLELALVYDVGECLVLLCYLEEGDGFLSPRVFARIMETEDRLRTILAADGSASFHAPNLVAKATQLYGARGPIAVTQAILPTIKKAQNVLNKFVTLKTTVWANQMKVWQFCRLFDPSYVAHASNVDLHADIMCHTAVSSLGPGIADALKNELATYKAAAMGVAADCDLCLFWRTHMDTLPNFGTGAKAAAIIQPSSAAAERVFAMLHWMFTKGQARTNEDYKMLSLIMRYNAMWRLKVQKLGGL